VFEYEWDTDEPAETRRHTFKRAVTRCPEHVALTDELAYPAVVAENSRKNATLDIVLGNVLRIGEEVTDESGAVSRRFLRGKEPGWSFDAARTLHLDVPTLTQAEKRSLVLLLDARFGVGLVLVD
jgi:hypothetical protein